MNVVIMGSGRTGALLASLLAKANHSVTVIDWNDGAFARLPDDFTGNTIFGNAMDQDVLRRAGIESADAFVATTSGDNRNVMASEVARFVFSVPKALARIKDPSRARFFEQLGLDVDCRTTAGSDLLLHLIDQWESEHAS